MNPLPQTPGWPRSGILFPHQRSNPCPLQRKCRVLTTGQPGKSLQFWSFLHVPRPRALPWLSSPSPSSPYFILQGSLCCAVLSHSVVSNSLRPHGLQPARLLCPWGFSRQEYWSGLPCPPPGDLPNPETEPRSPVLQGDSLLSEPPGKPKPYLHY